LRAHPVTVAFSGLTQHPAGWLSCRLRKAWP